MIEENRQMSDEQKLFNVAKEAIYQDSIRIKNNWEESYRKKRKSNLMALKDHNPNQMEIIKAIKEAQYQAERQFKLEFKGQRWRLIHRDVVKAEKQKMWENSQTYKRQTEFKKIIEQHELKQKQKQKQKQKCQKQAIKTQQEKVVWKDPLSGISNESGSIVIDGKPVIKLTGSQLVQNEGKGNKNVFSIDKQAFSSQIKKEKTEVITPGFAQTSSIFKSSNVNQEGKSLFGNSNQGSKVGQDSVSFGFTSNKSVGPLFQPSKKEEKSSGLFNFSQNSSDSIFASKPEGQKTNLFQRDNNSSNFSGLFAPKNSGLFGNTNSNERKDETPKPPSLFPSKTTDK